MEQNSTIGTNSVSSAVDASFLVILFCTAVVSSAAVGWSVSGKLGGWDLRERRVDWLLLYLACICLLDAILDVSFSLYTVTRGKTSVIPCRLNAAAAQWLSSQQAWLVCLLAVWHGGWLEAEKHPLTAILTGCVSGAIASIPVLVGRTTVHVWSAMMGCVVTAGDWCFYGAITSIWLYGLPGSAALICFIVNLLAEKGDQVQKVEDRVPNIFLAFITVCFVVFYLPSIAVQQSLIDCSCRGHETPWIVARLATWARYLGDSVLPCGLFILRPDMRRCLCCAFTCCYGRARQDKRKQEPLLLAIDHKVRDIKPTPVVQSVSVLSFEPTLPDLKRNKRRRKSYAYLSTLMLPPGSQVHRTHVNALLWT